MLKLEASYFSVIGWEEERDIFVHREFAPIDLPEVLYIEQLCKFHQAKEEHLPDAASEVSVLMVCSVSPELVAAYALSNSESS